MDRVISCSLDKNPIKNLANFLDENFLKQNKDISKLAFVFGGKRPSLFLKKELATKLKRGFLSPTFFSMDEFIEYLVSKKEHFSRISDLDACFMIYNLVKSHHPDILEGKESFSLFLAWSREILDFIEQLDLEDIKIKDLKEVQLKAEIGYDVPENINTLLTNVVSLRDKYHKILKDKKTYSRGLIYLLASEYISEIDFTEFNGIFFCDFFYLHKTEEKIIKSLYDDKKAVLTFQGTEKEWPSLDKISKKISCSIQPKEFAKPDYSLSIYSGFDVHSQVCQVREIIKNIKNFDKTVIVLPDPDNLIPLLLEISNTIDDFNVSMGYSLKRSSIYSLFELIFKTQGTKNGNEYYTKDYLKVLSHPLIKNLNLVVDSSVTRILIHKIEEVLVGIKETKLGGSIFVKLSDIEKLDELLDFTFDTMKMADIKVNRDNIRLIVRELHNLLFNSWDKINNFYEFSDCIKSFLDMLIKNALLDKYPLNFKIINNIYSIIEELKISLFNKEVFQKHDIFKIFLNKLDRSKISFTGSPLKGLQILGLFETRSLSFDNVIIMDTNETILPKLRIYEPLIPRDVMLSLGLNRLEKEDEIQRYLFMRLISSAKNVYLVYEEGENKGKSRYIEELIWNKQKELNSLDVLQTQHASFMVKVLSRDIEIKKREKIIKFLKNLTYSASSINTYINCPLKFYYEYVLGLKEKDDILDEPEGVDIGRFIHRLLEETFGKFINRKPCIDDKFREYFFTTFNKKFEDEFQKKMKSDSFLTKEILNFRLTKFLDNEKERNVSEILGIERIFENKVKLRIGEVNFKAIVDRIDRLNDGSILVIDYKTGSPINSRVINWIKESEFSRKSIKKNIKSFQLPLYLYFVGNIYKDNRINAGLYNLRNIEKDSDLILLLKEEDLMRKDEIIDVFMKALEFIISEILNPDISFKPDDEDIYQCSNCSFIYLCR